jgi:hypothetical protein
VQQVAAQLPWFHNCVLLDKVADRDERMWYARAAIHHGWSRAVLVHQIESDLHRRQGKAITNFNRALPPPQSDLAQEVTKDPYNFDCSVVPIGNVFLTILQMFGVDVPDRDHLPGRVAQPKLQLVRGIATVRRAKPDPRRGRRGRPR